jgi:hypothetical protein
VTKWYLVGIYNGNQNCRFLNARKREGLLALTAVTTVGPVTAPFFGLLKFQEPKTKGLFERGINKRQHFGLA